MWCHADFHNVPPYEFQVYTGAACSRKIGLGAQVVLDLAKVLEDKQCHLYVANFLLSTSFLSTLLTKGVLAPSLRRESTYSMIWKVKC